MKRIILLGALVPLLGACETIDIDGCRGWAKTATVNYGDSGITVTPRKNVKQQKPFVINLKPKPKNDWKDKNVIVKGTSRDPSTCPNESWLDTQDTYDVRKKFKYCTPAVPVDTDCEYKYSVEVKDGSTRLLFVDPRIEVEY